MDASGLRRLAGKWKIPLGIVEKDHAITVALGVLARLPCASHLAFKGGSALRKIHFGEYRFSEGLDFTAAADVASEVVGSAGQLLEAGRGASVAFTEIRREAGGRTSRRLLMRYIDMNGHPTSIRVELSLRERVLLPVELRPIIDPYGVLEGGLRMPTMALPEILAEKVRALTMRAQPRDLYDLWSLLGKGVPMDVRLIEAKLAWWKKGLAFDATALLERVEHVEATWKRDLTLLLPKVPPFGRVVDDVRAAFHGAPMGER